jgi:crotonobetainyl-CoA:carnitine CoA-transferase CaiB-like acyl-CoA transferase
MGPLEGIKVLDLSKYGPSRYCSMILADLGADLLGYKNAQINRLLKEDSIE